MPCVHSSLTRHLRCVGDAGSNVLSGPLRIVFENLLEASAVDEVDRLAHLPRELDRVTRERVGRENDPFPHLASGERAVNA